MELPVQAKFVEWNAADQVGWLEVASGERFKAGGSACVGFQPAVGLACWLVELKPDPITRGLRAKVVNLTGAHEADAATQALEKAAAAKRDKDDAARKKTERARTLMAEPASKFFEVVKAGTGFDVPPAYRAMVEDGSVLYGDDPNGYSFVELMRRAKPPALLCASVTWLHPFEIEDELVASRATSSLPADAGKKRVTAVEVRGAWRHEIPFARESGRGWWCWKSDWTAGGRTPVVHCAYNGTIQGFAPDLEGFLFRHMIEALHTQQALALDGAPLSLEQHRAFLIRCIDVLVPHVPAASIEMLRTFVARDVSLLGDERNRYWSFVSSAELKEIVARELAFKHLDQRVDVFDGV